MARRISVTHLCMPAVLDCPTEGACKCASGEQSRVRYTTEGQYTRWRGWSGRRGIRDPTERIRRGVLRNARGLIWEGWGGLRHKCAAARARADQSLRSQLLIAGNHSVAVYAKLFSQHPGAGQRIARGQAPAANGFCNSACQLQEQRHIPTRIQG